MREAESSHLKNQANAFFYGKRSDGREYVIGRLQLAAELALCSHIVQQQMLVYPNCAVNENTTIVKIRFDYYYETTLRVFEYQKYRINVDGIQEYFLCLSHKNYWTDFDETVQ